MHTVMTKLSTATVYTTLACTDLSKAEAFYRDSLGFDVERLPGAMSGSMVHCGHDTGISLYERPSLPSCDATAAVFIVEDLAATMSDLRSHDISFIDYDLPYLKTVNGVATDGTTKSAWFADPFGNILSLVQM
jgi:catechol 2,3-dioxygenase-like lactoylglutathione lyase family enzyme